MLAAAAAVTVVGLGGGAAAVIDPFGAAAIAHGGGAGGSDPPGVTSVTQGPLSSQVSTSGTLGYARPETVYGLLSGAITWLPQVGQVIKPGQALYRVENNPVVLFDGTVPAYRSLSAGISDGPDIKELNQNLVALGFDPDHQITVNDTWQDATTAAVKRWQASLGQPQTGSITLGQIVFLPGAQRITKLEATLGSGGGGNGDTSGSGSSQFTEMSPMSVAPEFVSFTPTATNTSTTTPTTSTPTTSTPTTTTPTTTTPTTTAPTTSTPTTTPTTTTPTTPPPSKRHRPTKRHKPSKPHKPSKRHKPTQPHQPGKGHHPSKGHRPSTGHRPSNGHQPGRPGTRGASGTAGGPGKRGTPTRRAGGPGGQRRSGTPHQTVTGGHSPQHTRGGSRSGGAASKSRSAGSAPGGAGSKPGGSSGGGGGPSATPVLQTTSTVRQVQVQLGASDQTNVKVGDPAQITLPNNETTPGVVTSIGAATGSSSGTGSGSGTSGPTIPVDIALKRPQAAGSLDEAPVQVQITSAGVKHALIVPVTALLALSGDRYALEAIAANGSRRLVPVTVGLINQAQGVAQVSASGLTAGERVVVPST